MDIDRIKKLYYEEHLTAKEIAEKLKVSLWQVYRFMKGNNLPRRDWNSSRHLRFLRSPLSYSKVSYMTPLLKELWIAGLMLYWAEGSKANEHTVDFANSNSEMNSIFLNTLRLIYRINPDRLRIFLYCYPNQDLKELISHWSSLLQIPAKQFTKPYVRHEFNPNKSGKMQYGLVHIRYSDKRLLSQIKEDIANLSISLSRDGRAVKYTAL